jgi:hypothetical protein
MGDFVIGERAAIYQNDYSSGRFTVAVVERDTKLYWIANGRKFRKSDGIEPGENFGWGRTTYLLPLDDKRVIEAGIAARKSAAYGQILKAQNELAKDRENVGCVEDLKAALDAYAAALP